MNLVFHRPNGLATVGIPLALLCVLVALGALPGCSEREKGADAEAASLRPAAGAAAPAGVPHEVLDALRDAATRSGASPADRARYGEALLKGAPRPGDITEAVRWIRDAATNGVASAQYTLGLLHEAGQGVPYQLAEAFEWFRRAALQGHPDAQYSLALAYATASGTAKDKAESVRWFREAALQGVAPAAFNLAQRYEAGQGVAPDPVEAAAWFQIALDGGFRDAQPELSKLQRGLSAVQIGAALSRVAELKESLRQAAAKAGR